LRLVHPFPSALNAALVLGLALLAGGTPIAAIGLAVAMLGLQFAIGAVNDLFDEQFDARVKPTKPLPSGLVGRPAAAVVAAASGGGGLLLASAFGPPVLALAAAMLGAGLVYDARLKRGPWAWTCFAVAFPLLPLYAWYGASGSIPPRPELLLPLAALAGLMLQLANSVVDVEADQATGLDTLAGRLGQRRAVLLMAIVTVAIYGLAWLTLATGRTPAPALVLLASATALAAIGVRLSAASAMSRRERGWRLQALGVAVLGIGWLAAVSGG
jgi:4-hydroxybenzoate polyprenyltransferase